MDPQDLGLRDLTRCESAEASAAAIGLDAGALDLAELHAPFSSQELILARALGLPEAVTVNPSGGPLCGNPMMAAGLIRIGEAARAVQEGRANRALAHATSGPCLQQNLLCLLEGDA